MRFGKTLIGAVVASSLISAPALAGSQNLSVSSAQRDAAAVGQEENMFGAPIFVALIGLALIVSVAVVALDDNNEDAPTSP
jgi:Ca2+/Na+ antiporter